MVSHPEVASEAIFQAFGEASKRAAPENRVKSMTGEIITEPHLTLTGSSSIGWVMILKLGKFCGHCGVAFGQLFDGQVISLVVGNTEVVF